MTHFSATDHAMMADAFTVARALDIELLNYSPLMTWDGDHPTTDEHFPLFLIRHTEPPPFELFTQPINPE